MGQCGSAEAAGGAEGDPALKVELARLEKELSAQRKRANDLEAQAANLAEENETYVKEQEEVHSVVTGFEQTMGNVVEEKEAVIKQLRVRVFVGLFVRSLVRSFVVVRK